MATFMGVSFDVDDDDRPPAQTETAIVKVEDSHKHKKDKRDSSKHSDKRDSNRDHHHTRDNNDLAMEVYQKEGSHSHREHKHNKDKDRDQDKKEKRHSSHKSRDTKDKLAIEDGYAETGLKKSSDYDIDGVGDDDQGLEGPNTNNHLYEVLGLSKDASSTDIQAAFKRLAKKYHPEKGETPSKSKFKEVGIAANILANDTLRREYDIRGDAAIKSLKRAAAHRQESSTPRSSPHQSLSTSDGATLSSEAVAVAPAHSSQASVASTPKSTRQPLILPAPTPTTALTPHADQHADQHAATPQQKQPQAQPQPQALPPQPVSETVVDGLLMGFVKCLGCFDQIMSSQSNPGQTIVQPSAPQATQPAKSQKKPKPAGEDNIGDGGGGGTDGPSITANDIEKWANKEMGRDQAEILRATHSREGKRVQTLSDRLLLCLCYPYTQ
eukprot:c1255_g1_i1.p1 GENE.c1255_g1_i1~~c1255_g1_i1.p1  ORF type:complete len:439 (+),score=103.03 c1255_g1_i1:77-1393(+)